MSPAELTPHESDLELIADPQLMQARALRAKRAGQRISFVPTMGYLHDGHVSLLRQARALGELLVVSDEALYRAKTNQRNTVVVAEITPRN